MLGKDSRRKSDYLYNSQQNSPHNMYKVLDRTIKKESSDQKKYSDIYNSEYQRFMTFEGNKSEQEKQSNTQQEFQLQYQQQLEQNNNQLNHDLDNLDNKYGKLLNELKNNLDECEKWKSRAIKLEQQQKDYDYLQGEVQQHQDMEYHIKQDMSVLQEKLSEKEQHLNSSIQENTKLIESQNHLKQAISQLEQDLLKLDKIKVIQLNELSNGHIIEMSKLSHHQKSEQNDIKIQLNQSNIKIKELLGLIQEQVQKYEAQSSNLIDRDSTIKQLKKELDGLQKKILNIQEDHNYDLKKVRQQMEDKNQCLQDENEEEKLQNRKQVQHKEEIIQCRDKQQEVLNADILKLETYVNQLEGQIEQSKIMIQDIEIRLSEECYKNNQEQNLINQIHDQDTTRIKTQLQQAQDTFTKDLELLQSRNIEKDKHIRDKDNQMKQQQNQRDKDKQQLQMQSSEIDLLNQQIDDTQTQKDLEIRIKEQLYEERIGSTKAKGEQNMIDAKNKLYQLQKIIEVQEHQLDDLEISREEVNMKLCDILRVAQHMKVENDQLKSTLASLQHQKSIEDDAKDEVKRKDVSQLRQYYETINEQMGYEVKGLQAMLDQKSKECEEWRTSFIRQRK